MPELKRNFTKGRMNKDLDERMVPNGEYRDALNVEVSTSEGSDVGTVQTLKGNTALTSLFGVKANCVSTVADEKNNKVYWFVEDSLTKNPDASVVYSQAEQDDATSITSIAHDIFSDYIIEYDEVKLETNYVVVEHWKVKTTISNDSHTAGDHLHVSNLGYADDIRYAGIQVGMQVDINGLLTTIIRIEKDAASYAGWRVYTEHNASDTAFAGLASVVAGDEVTFELAPEKRALGFSNFSEKNPSKIITGINIIDDLLFWTDGLTEPKKINIKRCIYGSQQLNPVVNPNGTRAFPTSLVVNGDHPSSNNGRLGSLLKYPSAILYPFLSYKQTTVIKKSPIDPLTLTMSNTTRPDQSPKDGLVVISANVTVSDTFFFDASGERILNGGETGTITFASPMDFEIGDTVEWFSQDDEAGFSNEPIAVAIVKTISLPQTFTFTIQSISPLLIKPFKNFRVELRQEDPLFEFKFPRFAYRWKYEDGEYSCYSPFSDIAFLPEEFDYLPKKGFNLGMTNNLRYLVLSGFKPKTMPIDVVAIDILYKESNSPNVYTVDTIKAPSIRVDYLGTDEFKVINANAWFGKIKHLGNFVESPSTLSTQSYLVAVSALTGDNTNNFFTLQNHNNEINVKVGDNVVLGNSGNIGVGTLKVSSMQNTSILSVPNTGINITASQISLTSTSSTGVVTDVTMSPTPTWLTDGNTVTFNRNIAKKPALSVGDPTGSIRVKSDMIHATLPSNQLLRPYDNVPKFALAQEITGNRIVYGNYLQNYNLVDSNNELTTVSFNTGLHTRSNVRQNVRYDDRTALVDQSNGLTISSFDPLNAVRKELAKPERSLKSLRDYQIGVVYMDEFGRQTPIQTHEDAIRRVPKSQANDYTSLRVQLDPEHTTFPTWATHFKFYIKENANEYYNLAMDRFYSAEDGNIWISFPSSERNKVDEETFLILKKQHDNDEFVREKARYKILAINNEAPLFVKTKMDSYGIVSDSFSSTGFPKIDGQFVDIQEGLFTNSSLAPAVSDTDEERVVRIINSTNKSRWYDVVSITDVGSYRRITTSKPFGIDVAFTTDDNTTTGSYVGGVSVEIAKKEVKNIPEFSGRFFIKIHKDGTFLKNITSTAVDRIFTTTETAVIARSSGTSGHLGSDLQNDFWGKGGRGPHIPWNEWFVDECRSQGCHQDSGSPYNDYAQGQGYTDVSTNSPGPLSHLVNQTETKGVLDISYHHLMDDTKSVWSIIGGNPSAHDLKVRLKLITAGTLFRFKGDSTIYRITGSREHALENYSKRNNGGGGYQRATNHRVKIRVEFAPRLGAGNLVKDAVGQPCTDYNPFDDGVPGTNLTQDWSGDWSTQRDFDDRKRTFEFVEEFAADDSYTSDNPAIWETEPKENVDIDLYNEASAALPIKSEFDTYENKKYTTLRHTSVNALDYYNCFSFNNGVESNRIRDDYNTVTIDKGPKVSTVLAKQYKEEHRKSGLIYSGIFNSTSGVNNLNQFIQAEKITKDVNPTYGSIQKLYSKDTNLVTFCEDRIIKVLANKDALFNADGNTNVTSTNSVLGSAVPYAGDYGISTDPESFAVDQHRAYFTDKSRGVVLRLSQDGLTPISDMGMRDYFKDVLKATNISLLGSYDESKKLYNLTMRAATSDTTTITAPSLTVATGTDYIDFANSNIIGYIPADVGGNPGDQGDGTGPFANGLAPPYSYGVIGNPSTSFNNANGGQIQTFGLYNASNVTSAGGQNAVNAVTQFHLPLMDWYSSAITSRISALTNALNSCPNGDVYLHAQIQAGGDQGRAEMPSTYSDTGFPIVTYKVNSINNTGTRFEIDVTYFSGLHGGNIDSYYFWYSTSGCDVSGGGDASIDSSADNSALGYTEVTASFSEDTKGWTSFKSWLQQTGVSINDGYFTFNNGELFQHHSNDIRNNFYGTQYTSTICALFNDMPSSVKSFGALSYEGSQSKVDVNLTDGEYYNNTAQDGWFAESITTDLENGQIPEFIEKEGKWFNYIRGAKVNNLANLEVKQFSTQGIGRLADISTTSSTPTTKNKLTIKDVGDID